MLRWDETSLLSSCWSWDQLWKPVSFFYLLVGFWTTVQIHTSRKGTRLQSSLILLSCFPSDYTLMSWYFIIPLQPVRIAIVEHLGQLKYESNEKAYFPLIVTYFQWLDSKASGYIVRYMRGWLYVSMYCAHRRLGSKDTENK